MTKGELGVLNKVLHRTKIKPRPCNNSQKNNLQGSSDFDPQTEADRSAQKCIIGSLSKQYSNLKIIGEEGATDLENVPEEFIVANMDEEFLAQYKCPESFKGVSENELVVWVDPLDVSFTIKFL